MSKTFKVSMNNGNAAEYKQVENGMYIADIRDKEGNLEAVCTRRTINEVWKWLDENETN